MKKVLRCASVLVFAGILLVSCNKNSAKTVATAWLNDFYHLDYDAAKPLSTEDTKTLIEQLQQLGSGLPDSSKSEMKRITVTVKDVKETGDTAIATYVISDNAGKDQNIKLVKVNGKWLVEFSKNDSFNSNDTGPDQASGADSTAPATSPADTNMTDTAKNQD